MKTILTTAALALALATPSLAFQRSIEGCEIVQVPGTNYFNLADPTCPRRTDGDRIEVPHYADWDEGVSDEPASDSADKL